MMHDFRREAMSGNLGDLESRLAELFGRAPGGDLTNRVELRRVGDDTVSITRVLCDGRRRGTLKQHTHHLLVIVGDGEAAFTPEDGATIISLPNVPVLLSAGHQYAYDVSATRVTLLQISSNFVRNRAAQRGTVVGIGAVFSQLRFVDDHGGPEAYPAYPCSSDGRADHQEAMRFVRRRLLQQLRDLELAA